MIVMNTTHMFNVTERQACEFSARNVHIKPWNVDPRNKNCMINGNKGTNGSDEKYQNLGDTNFGYNIRW